jgi:SecD/SecF fusion protein
VLHSPEAQRIFQPNLKFAWSAKPHEEYPDLITLIALRPESDGKPQLSGEHVIEAHDEIEPNYQQPIISITMDEEGASIWQNLTHENLGLQVAIVFDGYVYTHPMVQSEIAGGRTQVTGNFTVEEAHNLAQIMNARGYPAQVRAIGEHPFRGER